MPSFAIYRPSASEVDDAQPAIEERKRKRKQQQLDDLTNQVAQLENQNVQIEMQISLQRWQSTTMEVENAILRAQLHELTQRLQSLTPVLGITEEIGVMAMGKPETPARLLRPRQLPYSERPILAATAVSAPRTKSRLIFLPSYMICIRCLDDIFGAALLGLSAVVTVVLEGVIGVELVPDVAGRGAQLLSLVPRCDALSPLAASFAFLMLSATFSYMLGGVDGTLAMRTTWRELTMEGASGETTVAWGARPSQRRPTPAFVVVMACPREVRWQGLDLMEPMKHLPYPPVTNGMVTHG
ncbi:hypothetical protein OPV22_013783 [Ensete ventricosum]|uniref:BZIP domain-containing protein n=1 Tax=Ensete ventricosum TaxID=4639 RepID=A0AAV8R694_ENSVE|nr:hypothetical protein OPV22_013783 [Ensete ventricosum]